MDFDVDFSGGFDTSDTSFWPLFQSWFLGLTLSFNGHVVGDWHLKAESA